MNTSLGHGDEPPSLRTVYTINQRLAIEDGSARVVTLLEVWDDRLVLRWVDFALVTKSPRDVMRRQPGVVMSDDVGTQYTVGSSGFSGGKHRMEAEARFHPASPSEATELRFEWPSGEQTVVPLGRS